MLSELYMKGFTGNEVVYLIFGSSLWSNVQVDALDTGGNFNMDGYADIVMSALVCQMRE